MHLKDLGNLDKLINIFNTQGKTDGIDFFNTLDKATQAFTITSGKLTLNQLEAIKATAKWTDGADGIRTTLQGLSEKELDTAIKTATLSATQKEATTSTLGLGTAFKGLGASIKSFVMANPALTFAALATAAIAAGVAIYANIHPSLEAASKDLKDKKDEFDSITQEVSDLSTELKESKKRMTELQSFGSLSLVESEELSKLKETTAELETQLAIKKEEQRMQAKETANTASKAFHGTFRSKYDENGNLIAGDASRGNTPTGHGPIEELENSIKAYYKLQEQYNSAKLNADFFAKLSEKDGGRYSLTGKVDWAEYEKYAKQMDSYQKQMDSASAQANKMYEAINGQKEAYEGLYNAGYDLNQEQSREYETVRNNVDVYNDFCADINDTAKAFSELSAEQKRTKLVTQFILSGKSENDAKEIVDSLEDDDLNVVAKIRFDSTATKESVKKALDEAKNAELEIKAKITFSDFLSSLPFDKVEEFVALFKSGAIDENTISSYSELNAIMERTGISAENAVKELKEFSKSYTLPSEMISNLQDASDLITSLQKRKTVQFDTSSLEKIVKLYPEMESALSDYTIGLITEQQIIDELKDHYDLDMQNYGDYLIAKNQDNLEFANTVGLNSAEVVNKFSEDYGIDIGNHTTYAEKKLAIEQQTLQTISDMWSKYYDTQSMSLTKAGQALEDAVLGGAAINDPATIALYQKLHEQAKIYEDAVNALNNISYKGVEANFKGVSADSSKGSGKDKKEKEPKTKDFDWIKRRQELLQSLHDKEMENANDESASYQTRIALTDSLIAKDKERLAFNEQAAASYSKVWEEAKEKILAEAAKQNQDGNGIIASIMEGNIEDQTITDKTDDNHLIDAVQEAVDAYDNLTEGQKKSEEISKEINEHLKKQLELKLAITQEQVDLVKAEADSLDAEIQLMEATGKAVTEKQLKKQISLSEDLVDSYYDQISALQDQLDQQDEGSAEYYSLLSQINQCEAAIADCAVQQAEWNDQIKRLPIERINKFLELLGFIKEDLQNFIDQQNALGKATTLSQYEELGKINNTQLKKLAEQQKLLGDLLNDYEYGSTKYQDTVSDLQDIDNEISNLIQNQYDWNKAILQLPIDQLSKAGDVLQNAVTAMSDILADYDSAISAVTGTLDKQIKAINDLKDATTDEYESKIKPLQDELDTLQKQNEARKIQLDLEKAQYDLDRANEQKTNKVVRDGEMVYEADQDAIRSAENTKNDAEYNKVVHDLEEQISNLEEERDKLLEGYDDQIEKLDEIKDRWSSIVEEIKLAADALKANDVLGAGWQDKILSGNDEEMLNSLKDLYTTISNQKNQYEEQIASNERIADMMNQFMESWQNGSITYDQAMAGIKDLANQMKDGYSSLEHLDAIMGLNGATDLGSLLDKMQNSANASVDQFEDYMKIVKENADALDQYNSSWEEMQQNIRDQIAALEKLAEEAAKMANTINKHTSSGGGGGNKGPNVNDKTFVDSGPGVALAKALGDEEDIPKYHDGGIVKTKDSTGNFIELISSERLKSDETYAKLRNGEFVMTPEQQQMLMENLVKYPLFNYQPAATSMPSAVVMKGRNDTAEVNINIKDMNLTGIHDVKEFVHDFHQHVEPSIRQAFSKIYNY